MQAKLTKNCIAPWRTVEFLADGSVSPCCGPIKGDFGNLSSDLDTLDDAQGLFRNAAYRRLRSALLSGDVPAACRDCRVVHDPDIPIDTFAGKVAQYLEGRGVRTAGADLAELYAFDECGGNITNRCNFSCIYCVHSGESGHRGTLGEVMDRHLFMTVLDRLVARGLKIFNFCGLGELTNYRDWRQLCEEIFDRHPGLKLRLITNFGRRLDDRELALLTRFEIVQISCDTFDEARFAWLRTNGQLSVLRANLDALLDMLRRRPSPAPRLVFNITVTDANIDDMADIFRYAADNGMDIHLSALFDMEGSLASGKRCLARIWEVPDARLLHNREVYLDLPRRMKAAGSRSVVWEYQHLHRELMQRADRITLNQFVPDASDLFLSAFFAQHTANANAFLRKLWLDFDLAIKGIWIAAGAAFAIALPHASARLTYCCHRIRTSNDGRLSLARALPNTVHVGATLEIFAADGGCAGAFLEIVDYRPQAAREISPRIAFDPGAAEDSGEIPVWEEMDGAALTRIIARFVESREPLVIWCAGLKTLQTLTDTRLAAANIAMIVDGDATRHGTTLCGHPICAPAAVLGCSYPILVLHNSAPAEIEKHIRRLGIQNEILVP